MITPKAETNAYRGFFVRLRAHLSYPFTSSKGADGKEDFPQSTKPLFEVSIAIDEGK